MAMVQFIETTTKKLGDILITAGNLIYLSDSGSAYFDSADNKRVEITSLYFLKDDAEKEALTNPINGKFYFVKDSSALFVYVDNNWFPIKPEVDAELNDTSENPIQNKAVYTALEGKANTTHTHENVSIQDDAAVIEYDATNKCINFVIA